MYFLDADKDMIKLSCQGDYNEMKEVIGVSDGSSLLKVFIVTREEYELLREAAYLRSFAISVRPLRKLEIS